MVPFKRYQTMCPYLVGTYQTVADQLQTYIEKGYRTFILDIPSTRDDLFHTLRAFENTTEAAISDIR